MNMEDITGLEIDITIIQGEDLVAKDRNLLRKRTTSDPYIRVLHNGCCHHKTAVQKKNLNPKWNQESFKIHTGPPANYNNSGKEGHIAFYVYDHDEFSDDDNMGCFSIPLSDYMNKPPTTAWFPVQKNMDVDRNYDCLKASGRIQLSISISVRKRLNVKRGNSQELRGKIQVHLNWELEGAEKTDLDTSCVAINSLGNILMEETVYFADLINSNGSIRHTGDVQMGGTGKGENIHVDLASVRPYVTALYFILSVATPGKTFADVESAEVIVKNSQFDLCRFVPTFAGSHTSMFLMRIARDGGAGVWKMTIIEDTDHTARDFGTLIPEIKGYSRDLVPGIQINPTERVAIMRKGGAVCLEDYVAGKLPESLTFGLAWDVTNGVNIDLDASAICLNSSLAPVDIVWFRKLTSDDRAIQHSGDEREGDEVGDDEKIQIQLGDINPDIKHIAFVINSFSGQELDDIRLAACHLFDPTTGVEIAKYKLSNNGDLDKHTALLVATLYRSDKDGWCLRIISEAAQGKVAKDLVDELQGFLIRNPPPPISRSPEPDIIVNEMPEDVDIVIEANNK
eukprot:CAMPEP_0194076552 /NCGR_PEP_ID=MMETSP0149-20130528/3338_1 /TAXON_ID=122233 /ORGANISM="Chaetoceros debilis, Strain MM31A-1" /LENGTH=566 /DNA_ID=CAMNT_0038757329 /DNA_START=31 /DNA_END=1729 /DNA_ORIENTATION=+